MSLVNGEGVVIKFLDATGAYTPFACARSITVNMISDFVGKSTIGSGNWKEKEAVALDWNFTIEGIIYLNEIGSTEAGDIIDIWLNMQPVGIAFFIVDINGNEILMTGSALITGATTNGAVNNVSSFNVTGEGTGALQKTTFFAITNVVIHASPVNAYDITFDYGSYPGATTYTIEVGDLTAGTTTTDAGGAAPREIAGLPSNHNYSFRLKNDVTNIYGDYIYYPASATDLFVMDSDGEFIIDSDNANILT